MAEGSNATGTNDSSPDASVERDSVILHRYGQVIKPKNIHHGKASSSYDEEEETTRTTTTAVKDFLLDWPSGEFIIQCLKQGKNMKEKSSTSSSSLELGEINSVTSKNNDNPKYWQASARSISPQNKITINVNVGNTIVISNRVSAYIDRD